MLLALKTGPLPLLYPCRTKGLREAVAQAAKVADKSARFSPDDVRLMRRERPDRQDYRLPLGSGVLYLEMWGDDADGQDYTIGVIFDRARADFIVALGKGWPGDDPEILPAVFSARAGG
ncbi:hypothetical protein, partial [Kozakia baliensis]|uniref:hypothetical protein n=1 Tax=Kozakia baliensis TaxID=153496 RepID=UPI000495B6C6